MEKLYVSERSNAYYQSLRPFLIISQLFGFHPITNLYKNKNDNVDIIFKWVSYPTLYSFIVISASPIFIVYLKSPEMHSFKYFFYIIEYIQIVILGLLIISSIKSLIQLIQKINLYDKNITKHREWKVNIKIMKKAYIIFITIFVGCIILRLMIVFIYSMKSGYKRNLEVFIHIFSLVPMTLNIFLFIYFCDSIKLRFLDLNSTLNEIIFKRKMNIMPEVLGIVRLHHLDLIDCQHHLEKSFGKYMSIYFLFTLLNGLISVYNVAYFTEYTSLFYLIQFLWSFIFLYFTIISSDKMLDESCEARNVLVQIKTSELSEYYYDEVQLFLLQIETLIGKVQGRNVVTLNRELFGSFTLLFVLYFITVIQLSSEINSLASKYFNVTVSS